MNKKSTEELFKQLGIPFSSLTIDKDPKVLNVSVAFSVCPVEISALIPKFIKDSFFMIHIKRQKQKQKQKTRRL